MHSVHVDTLDCQQLCYGVSTPLCTLELTENVENVKVPGLGTITVVETLQSESLAITKRLMEPTHNLECGVHPRALLGLLPLLGARLLLLLLILVINFLGLCILRQSREIAEARDCGALRAGSRGRGNGDALFAS